MINDHVNYREDIQYNNPLHRILCGAYEKCNIYPAYINDYDFANVIVEELQEVIDAAKDIKHYIENDDNLHLGVSLDVLDAEIIKRLCESAQVYSVMNKWRKSLKPCEE